MQPVGANVLGEAVGDEDDPGLGGGGGSVVAPAASLDGGGDQAQALAVPFEICANSMSGKSSCLGELVLPTSMKLCWIKIKLLGGKPQSIQKKRWVLCTKFFVVLVGLGKSAH